MTMSSFIAQASDHAAQVDRIFILLVAISGAIILLVLILVTTFAVRYRRGSNARRGRLPGWMQRELEIGWTAATLFVFLFLFWWAASSQLSALAPAPGALEIHVEAKQWMWKAQQPNGIREINELHVPEGKPVRLVMTSQDVIHSMFLPSLRIKQDVLPGRTVDLWFTAKKTGTFALMCAEFCGTEHSRMTGRIVIMPQAEYARWSAAPGQGDDLARLGGDVFRKLGCSGCHGANASVHAPDLSGLFGRIVMLDGGRQVVADEAYIRDSILMPARDVAAGYQAIMPSYRGVASEDDLVKLVAYIKSLSTQGARQ
jgi:cytochrome c oxidase subunit 2